MLSPDEIDARIRSQWEELSRICPNRNYASCENVDRSTWTDPRKTEFSQLTFNVREVAERHKNMPRVCVASIASDVAEYCQ